MSTVLKQLQFKVIKGMCQDVDEESNSPDTAYRLLNMKTQLLDNNVSTALVNEKGTKQMSIILDGSSKTQTSLPGEVLGIIQCTDNTAVIFAHYKRLTSENAVSMERDIIYKVTQLSETDNIIATTLAYGTFNLGDDITGLFNYENSELQKVYWVDGVNQLRFINIADSNPNLPITSEHDLNSNPAIDMNHKFRVTKTQGNGIFPAGVIQYCFTYFNKYGAETNIVDISPLFYIAENNRGLAADETTGCAFKIEISNPDHRFEFIRLYSIIRTSYNGQPIVKKVQDIPISKEEETDSTGQVISSESISQKIWTEERSTYLGAAVQKTI